MVTEVTTAAARTCESTRGLTWLATPIPRKGRLEPSPLLVEITDGVEGFSGADGELVSLTGDKLIFFRARSGQAQP